MKETCMTLTEFYAAETNMPSKSFKGNLALQKLVMLSRPAFLPAACSLLYSIYRGRNRLCAPFLLILNQRSIHAIYLNSAGFIHSKNTKKPSLISLPSIIMMLCSARRHETGSVQSGDASNPSKGASPNTFGEGIVHLGSRSVFAYILNNKPGSDQLQSLLEGGILPKP
ncbi:hypothetical protein BO94DRAFT_380850 [Aspergillus sclerotioniger CBS 115572]|uniref:Uncharacterized protein n=1 Tax=Aspergillus sclerotioniger CBS 115572 TaxID=1450535 RepID=A0A317WZN7_9EURO|nr:hypothetical protein BO94DRAFT_380850 [Aspergillus sclerotioniger CBS 115572]PWY91829.1 hypothetical protein BO94DRAFT_380850 [Aspergillus sclerotioniger CBS 115572]